MFDWGNIYEIDLSVCVCVCVCAWGVCREDSWCHNHVLSRIIRILNSASFSRSVFLFDWGNIYEIDLSLSVCVCVCVCVCLGRV